MTATNRWMSELDFAKTQLAILVVILLLAVDALNPVKLFLHVFAPFNVAPWHIASLAVALMLYVFLNNMKELLYFGVKVFFHSILSIFFNRVEAVGLDNVPPYGPVIFTSNHANQFIDGVLIMCTCRRKISYLVAEKSWNRRIIGDIAWAMGAVPVKRAQDSAVRGVGTVFFRVARAEADVAQTAAETAPLPEPRQLEAQDGEAGAQDDKPKTDAAAPQCRPETTRGAKKEETAPAPAPQPAKSVDEAEAQPSYLDVTGIGTAFASDLARGDKIRPPGAAIGLKVTRIDSDTSLRVELDPELSPTSLPTTAADDIPFDVLKRVDQKVVYEKVLDELASGGTIGIFPEGGSHDRTDLLPLKVGVALIAYSALEKDGAAVPIVPVGLNYFRAHRFRGRAIVEFGRPIYVDPETLHRYKAGGASRRKVCNDLLERIEDSMRTVIVSTPDYDVLQLIHVARRLYQRKEYSASEKQDMTRRFAEGYKRLMLQTGGKLPPEWSDLQDRIVWYRDELRDLGIRDYQVMELDRDRKDYEADRAMRDNRILYHVAHLFVVLVLAAVPAVALNLPVGLLARLYSDSRRRKALAASKVKIKGRDVVLSEKVLFCIVAVPTLWAAYSLALLFGTGLDRHTVAFVSVSMPLFSYVGVVAAEAGVADWKKDLRPYLMRLFPSAKKRMAALPEVRRNLQRDLRAFVAEIGPSMGDLYYEKDLDWKGVIEDTRKSMVLLEAGVTTPVVAAAAAAAATSKKDQ